MPQLAPLSWALAPLLFWALLLSLAAAMWWSNTPNFPEFNANTKSNHTPWHWQ
uniref:ATP synthase F0 subunit 8 n=1 Tax=Prionospio sp. 4 MH-2023 TaxID=3059272 RepID=A0AAU6QG70_9ANNE